MNSLYDLNISYEFMPLDIYLHILSYLNKFPFSIITPSGLAMKKYIFIKKNKQILDIINKITIEYEHCKIDRKTHKTHLRKSYFLGYNRLIIKNKSYNVMNSIILIIYICEYCGNLKTKEDYDDEYYCNKCNY